jgi:methanogenic corrinoid protein MtbC1
MEKGASIGSLAALGRERLLSQLRSEPVRPTHVDAPFERLLTELIAALDPFDRTTFERRLNGAVAVIPFEEALDRILLPLQERIGDLWHEGKLSVAIEHYVTKQVQQKLFTAMNQLPIREEGPKIVIACPIGQFHEIGAQSVAYRCGLKGCRVYFLGTSVPASALAAFCRQTMPDLVVLSITAAAVEEELREYAREVTDELRTVCPIKAGGAGALAMKPLLEGGGIEVLDNLSALMSYVSEAAVRHRG